VLDVGCAWRWCLVCGVAAAGVHGALQSSVSIGAPNPCVVLLVEPYIGGWRGGPTASYFHGTNGMISSKGLAWVSCRRRGMRVPLTMETFRRVNSRFHTPSRRMHPRRLFLFTLTFSVLVLSACAGNGPQSAIEPAGKMAENIDKTWDLVLMLATIVFFLVEGALVVTIWKFRHKKGADDVRPKQIHGNTAVEIAWTIIPALILAILAVPNVKGILEIRTVPVGDDVLQVQVIGHQWWWEFRYPDLVDDQGNVLVTANELYIPEQTRVNLSMTSADVIHSFWVPKLNGKRDLVPGKTSNLTLIADAAQEEPFFGQCAEFCGLSHADMRIKVYVKSVADFDAWTAAQLLPAQIPTDPIAKAGYDTFVSTCAACHAATVQTPNGVEIIGKPYAPNLTHFGSRNTFGGATFENTTELLTQWIHDPSSLKPMNPDANIIPERILGMPSFGLTDAAVAELVALLEGWK